MSTVVDALIAVMETGKHLKKPNPQWLARAETASGDARRLLGAIASYAPPTWELGRRFIVASISTFAAVQKRTGVKLPFDIEHSCEMGNAYSPGPTWGFTWTGKKLTFVEVAENKKVTMYTPAAWFRNLRTDELALWAEHDREPSDALVEFLAACGKPYKPKLSAKSPRAGSRRRT